ncbi:MAG TPA: hypothetical protein PK453_08050 [Leptospiraceae bacterium]|nr:hypothetical protein [Leptospiraceae bacterium]HMY69527.1 hypothetical protein [Leptospiraceae bacterium]HNF13606.1 hypothetical protein [Leptospiraceae bacterium]HNF25925.1 hypothetical protein [Leptospiraceae bacterium]HNI97442.1 hypothetical protein [Leptospiraceae bacterium]
MGEYYDSLASRLAEDNAGDDGEGNLIGLLDDGSIEIIYDDQHSRIVRPDDSYEDLSPVEEGDEGPEVSEDEEEAQSEEEYTE